MKIGYARVSTADQTADLQRDALRETGCDKIFEDCASGSKADRPGLEEALKFARQGDVLVVWKLDRLGRSIRHLIDTIEDLNKRGIGFCSLRESMDSTTSGGRLVFNLFASIAEFERDLIRERTMAGIAAARARGRMGGRPKAMNDDKIHAAMELLRGGKIPVSQICTLVGVSKGTIYRHVMPRLKAA